jgi:hypothetical protein
MKRSFSRLLTLLWLVASPAWGDEPVPIVVGAHASPSDLRSLCVAGETLIATTTSGLRWSARLRDVVSAIGGASTELTPDRPAPSADCREDVRTALPDQLDGFRVNSGVSFGGELFLGTFGGGLRRPANGPVPRSPAEIRDLAVIGHYLLIAHRGGLAAFDGETVSPIPLAGPPVVDVTAVEWVDGVLWVGSFDRGIVRLRDHQWEKVAGIESHRGDWINALCWDGSVLWVGSAAGLGRWEPMNDRVIPESRVEGRVQSVQCGDREMVVATASSVWVGRDDAWTEVDLTGDALHAATRFRGAIWAAGLRGVLRRRGDRWVRDTELNGRLPDSWVTALLPDGDAIWAGTYDSGLLRLDAGGRWRPVVRDAWVNPNAMTLTPRGIAVGTMGDGLLLFDRSTRGWHRLTVASGLPSDDVTSVLSEGETLWVGTRAGIAEVRW